MGILNNKARFIAVTVFLSDVLVLILVLALLWSMSNQQNRTNCETMCLGSQCKCRTHAVKDYLDQTFLTEFKIIEEKRRKLSEQEATNARPKINYKWNVKPIARLSGSKETMPKDYMNRPLMPMRNWESGGRSNCYVRNGMGYRNGRLVIPVDGLYNIYSFLDLFLEYRDQKGEDMMKFKTNDAAIQHKIFKFNIVPSKEEEVLSTYMPYQYSQNGRFNFYVTYLSAVVNLKAGDEVYLKVTNISYIRNPSKNYFGIHML